MRRGLVLSIVFPKREKVKGKNWKEERKKN